MEKYIDNIRKVNNAFVRLMNNLSVEQLNKIPDGFNNNIIWNFAHLLAVQQSLFYRLSNLQSNVDAAFIPAFKSGTKPEKFMDENEINHVKQMFANAIDTLENDYKNHLFKEYTTYQTSLGVVLANIDDAIEFSTFHDGLHLGYAMALKHLV